jgi:hypothetical protein
MWKNVRKIIALMVTGAYIIFTGYEVYKTNAVSNNFYSVTSLVLGFYFITRANENKEGKPNG